MMVRVTAAAIVLKFGGSVLRGDQPWPAVVAEIGRHRALGRGVLAVVSALPGRTDALLAECGRAAAVASPLAVAARAALGELESATRLGVELARAAIDSAVLEPAAIALRALGPALDADPVTVDTALLRAALLRPGVVVVPGFCAVDARGRTVLLGRGGSDLTALFLAATLGLPCRLLKDSGGLCARDPRGAPGPVLAGANYQEVERLGDQLVQPKALAFARARGLRFAIGGLGDDHGTSIGADAEREAGLG